MRASRSCDGRQTRGPSRPRRMSNTRTPSRRSTSSPESQAKLAASFRGRLLKLELGLEKRTRDLVRDRACNTCEYCRLHQSATPLIAFHLEHILPKQHGKADDPAGLALAWDRCN